MPDRTPNVGAHVSIAKESLQRVFDVLREMDYTLVGPTLGEAAIVYEEIENVDDLPVGWTAEQEAGTYRLTQRGDGAYFGYASGPHSWKKFLFPPELKMASVERQTCAEPGRSNGSFTMSPVKREIPQYAFIGVRPCDFHAIEVQDRVFLEGVYQDPSYKVRRQRAFILAVNCTEPGGTCFCASMGTGPEIDAGFDLALTELDDVFVVRVGSEMGAHVMTSVGWRPAGAFELQTARQAIADAKDNMGRVLDTSDLPNLLYQNLEHPRWDQVAGRCLSCTNCTQVCPTCFCSDVLETSDLTGQKATRTRVWDSCFNLSFSHVHGGNIRPHTRSRYRQWLSHKLASWIDQFGVSGCVGCGRCITWCPVGIDITEEVDAIRAED